MNCLPFARTWVHPWFLGGVRVAHLFSFFVLSYYVSLRSEFRVVMPVTISAWKWCSVRLFLRLFVGGRMSYLRYLCLFAYCGVQHIWRCFSSSMLPVSLNCPFLIAPSVFSNVYFFNTIQFEIITYIYYWNLH